MSSDDRHGDRGPHRTADTDADLDQAFERVLASDAQDQEGSSMRIVVPRDLLAEKGASVPELLDLVLTEWGEIEKLLATLEEHEAESPDERVIEDAVAVVSDRELADPEALAEALAPLQSEATRLEFLYARAKYGLERLGAYRLSELTPGQLVEVLRAERNQRAVKNLVGFLRALNRAADSFEALSLPRAQIREYLQQLYTMEDWREMESWVRWLEGAVARLPPDERAGDEPPGGEPPTDEPPGGVPPAS